MTRTSTLHRWTLAALSVAALTLTLAPLAQADPGWRHGRHENGGRWGRPWGGPRGVTVIHEREHGAGPALAGLFGGLILGAALAQSHPVMVHRQVCAPPPDYRQDCSRNSGYGRYDSRDQGYRRDDSQDQGYRRDNSQDQGYRRDNSQDQGYRRNDSQDQGYQNDRSRTEERNAPQSTQYRYEDPNSDRWFDTLDECRDPQYGQNLPTVIHQVDAATGRTVRTFYWKYDHWISDDDHWGQ